MGALSRLFKSVFIWTINVFMIDCTNREASTPAVHESTPHKREQDPP